MIDHIRRARLKGTRKAEDILKILDVRPRLMETQERVDVFDALAWLDVRVMFRPLQGLLGAYMRGDVPGVLISTQRQLSVQRFTAAHELGHAVLNHKPSLDSPDVLRRAANSEPAPAITGFASYLQEIEADAFAGALLLPIWLITHHARKQSWSRANLSNDDVVYQLSLRCGVSFQATIWALARHRFITTQQRVRLLETKPKTIKSRLGHSASITRTRADAWKLTHGDAGADIPVMVGDTVTVTLSQQAGSGYLWRFSGKLPEQLSEVMAESNVDRSTVGAPSARNILYRADAPGTVALKFEHKRLWENASIDQVSFNIDINKPERGLSRANRARLISRQPSRLNAI